MKLITKAIAAKLPALYANEGKAPADVPVVAKFFTPWANATWFITEGDLSDGTLWGLCDLGLGMPELGYVNLATLEELKGPFGLKVERDLYYTGTLAKALESVGLSAEAA